MMTIYQRSLVRRFEILEAAQDRRDVKWKNLAILLREVGLFELARRCEHRISVAGDEESTYP